MKVLILSEVILRITNQKQTRNCFSKIFRETPQPSELLSAVHTFYCLPSDRQYRLTEFNGLDEEGKWKF